MKSNLFEHPKTVVITYCDGGFFKCVAVSVRDALIQLADYFGENTELFGKAMRGMETERDCIDCFNHFSWTTIEKIFIVEREVYDRDVS